MTFVSPKDLTAIQFCGLLRNLRNPCQIDGHSGAKDVAEGACSHQETLPEAAAKATSAKGVRVTKSGFQLYCYLMLFVVI